MSAYENVVSGKLKLKGKALDVKSTGVKRKRKQKHHSDHVSKTGGNEEQSEVHSELSTEAAEEIVEAEKVEEGSARDCHDHLTAAEKRYLEQRGRIDMHLMAKTASKSHRDRIQDFNQYLANLSEHYDIPKVGPG
ncbi:hypothetical protein HPP92_014811 [Vanilla planifolia]|uniref:Protein FAM32A-like n=1 Tax=Vanilla planifolia TaxID=51239 RepID=A0A835QRQ2_VANPL|nr:hypothetical protein HPP92_014811 [Vanilla planifolia]